MQFMTYNLRAYWTTDLLAEAQRQLLRTYTSPFSSLISFLRPLRSRVTLVCNAVKFFNIYLSVVEHNLTIYHANGNERFGERRSREPIGCPPDREGALPREELSLRHLASHFTALNESIRI